jgi:ketosteroid isomerase-like protein
MPHERSAHTMSLQDNTYIAQNIHPLWTNREFDRILTEMIDEDAEWMTVPTGEVFRGHEGFRRFMQGWADAFPDGRAEDAHVYVGEDFAVTEFVARGTHEGPLRSPGGEISPTGRPVEFELCEVYQIRNGRIHSARTYFDTANLMHQLGVLAEPEGASRTEETTPTSAEEVSPRTEPASAAPGGEEEQARAGEVPPRTEPAKAPAGREEDDRGLLDRARDALTGQEEEEPRRREEPGTRREAPRGPGGDEPLRGR